MVTYRDLIREIALRVDAVAGTTPALKETALNTNPYTATQIGNVDFPFTTITRAAVAGVARLVRAYAFVKNHPFRLQNLTPTANIAHKSELPKVNAANKPIVGVFGVFYDASNNEPLTQQPKQIIESILKSKADGTLKRDYYYYQIADGRIYHTRANVKADALVFDLAAEKAAAAAGTDSPLPDVLYDAAWAAGLALLFADNDYLQTASLAENYVQNVVNEIKSGAIEFQPAPEFAVAAKAES